MIDKNILSRAYDAWTRMGPMRTDRLRHKRYTYGDQWSDIVHDRFGRAIPESEMIIRSGQRPLTNNLIRRVVKAIIGHYRTTADQAGTYGHPAPVYAPGNDLAELDSRMLEEYLISGCAIQRVVAEKRPVGRGVWVDNVSIDRFFVEDFRDPRGHDITMLGMLHDMTPGEVVARFSHGERARGRRVAAHYGSLGDIGLSGGGVDGDFYVARRGRWRVIEVWTLEPREVAVNLDRTTDAVTPTGDGERASRWQLDFKWHCRWLTPKGEILDEYDSPYAHATHPFVLKFYPLTDGEVHSFVEDIIEQQHYINRVIVMIDKMLDSSAKGVLLFPESQKPSSLSWEDISNCWSSPDAILPITDRSAHLPQQITTAGGDAGAHRLLELELRLMEDTSGVSGTLLGDTRDMPSNAGSALFEGQVRQSASALADIVDTFRSFTQARDAKALHTV